MLRCDCEKSKKKIDHPPHLLSVSAIFTTIRFMLRLFWLLPRRFSPWISLCSLFFYFFARQFSHLHILLVIVCWFERTFLVIYIQHCLSHLPIIAINLGVYLILSFDLFSSWNHLTWFVAQASPISDKLFHPLLLIRLGIVDVVVVAL